MKNKTKFDIYRTQIIEAITHKLIGTEVLLENQIRRWYSSTFKITMNETFELSWPSLIKQYYENKILNMDYNDVYDLAVQEYLTKFKEEYEKENEEFAQSLLEEQKQLEKKQPKLTKKQKEAEEIVRTEILKEYNIDFKE